MNARADSVVVRVPASTSNCGSGFDTLGLALRLYNRVSLSRTGGDAAIPERPEDARAQSMVDEAAESFARGDRIQAGRGSATGSRADVPAAARPRLQRVTVTAGILAGMDALAATSLGTKKLVGLVAAIEGHPDNAAAGILGGFCVSRSDPVTQEPYVDIPAL